MRVGVVVSTSLHMALLVLLIFRLPQAEPYEVEESQAFDVEIVPFADVPTTRLGTQNAELRELAAVLETGDETPQEGRFQGNAARDLNEAPTEDPTNLDVRQQQSASADAAPLPISPLRPSNSISPVEEPPVTEQTTPADDTSPPEPPEPPELPEPEAASAPQPVAEVAEEPLAPEDEAAEAPATQQTAPSPPPAAPRPRPREIARAAAAIERQPTDDTAPRQEPNPDASSQAINRQEISGGGTQSSDQQASLGAQSGRTNIALTQSEEDNLRRQIEPCWSPPVGIADGDQLRVSMRFGLNLDGSIAQNPQVVNSGNLTSFPGNASAFRAAASAAQRAILRCAPYQMPPEKYEAWRDVIVNFDPRDLF